MTVTPEDQAARDRIRNDVQDCLLVEAAAGTGKTYELVQRLVRVLAKGAKVDRIVAVTFTRKAAGELKLRLRQELDAARRGTEDPVQAAHLDDALARLEEARVGTIHSFCAEILRERPVEARVDPAFGELDDAQARRVYDRAFRRFIQDRLSNPSPTLSRALARPSPNWDGRSPLDRLSEAGWDLVQWRDFTAPWKSDHFDLSASMEQLALRVQELADLSTRSEDPGDDLFKSLGPARELAAWMEQAELDGGRTDEALESRLIDLAGGLRDAKVKKYGPYAPGVSRVEVIETRDKLVDDLTAFQRRADAQLAVQLREELSSVVQAYQALKRRLGVLDFEDLLLGARDLIRGDERVRRYLQGRFSHIFVDEYQDTDPLQTEILLLLAGNDGAESDWRRVRPTPGKLFVVGDPKQSIYRFRRADVVLYQRVRSMLVDRGMDLVHLTHSFRATDALQSAINLAFRPEMKGDAPGQPSYVPLQGGPAAPTTQPSLVAVPVPYPHGFYSVTNKNVTEDLPHAVGSFVAWLLADSGWTIRDPQAPDNRVPIQPRHIALLFKRFTAFGKDVTRPYVRDLEERGIQHLLVGSRTFREREEIDALLAASTAIEWPEDELSVVATLRGPLFALPDDLLFRYKNSYRSLHPFKPVPKSLPEDLRPVQEALQILADLAEQRNRRSVAATLSSLLRQTRAHAGFALRPGGNEVLSNVQRALDMARVFEMQGGLSFRGFVERLSEESERPRSNESPAFEEDTDGVRMMTAHASKGLEFPVVILADIGAPSRPVSSHRHVDADKGLVAMRLAGCAPRELLDHQDDERGLEEAESVRLAYVAATRARDLLVVPGIGEGTSGLFRRTDERTSWVAPLEKVIYPVVQNYQRPVEAAGVPVRGARTVLGAPLRGHPARACIAPGLHIGRAGGPGAAWMDPEALIHRPPQRYGLRNERFLAEGSDDAAARSVQAYADWQQERIVANERGAVTSVDLIRASDAEVAPEGFEGVVDAIVLPRADRPSGARFGTLVHAVLRDVPFDADARAVAQLAKMHGRLLGAPSAEIDAASAPVQAILQHDLLRRAHAAERSHREYPLVFETEEGQRLDGSLDLAFREPSGWVVVDFKTDADPQAHREAHTRQMQWYVHALGRMTGADVIGFLLYA